MKLKAFSIILKELSIARNYLRPESRTLKIPEEHIEKPMTIKALQVFLMIFKTILV